MHKLYSLKKAKKILIATNNPGKFKELKEILPKKIKYFKPRDFNLKEPIENGKTFKANAKIKSLSAAKKTGIICISDDSGLEVDSLNKRPGIFSARWAGPSKDFNIAIKKIYNLLKKKNKLNSKARFVCALSICYFDKIISSVIGKIEGYISKDIRGKNGFGYDPIFIPKKRKQTFGEMKFSNKCKIDHRSIAFKKIKKFL